MNKRDLLALIEECQKILETLLERQDLSDRTRNSLLDLLKATKTHYNIVSVAKDDDIKLFNSYSDGYSRLYYKLNLARQKAYNRGEEIAILNSLAEFKNINISTHVVPPKKNDDVIDVEYEDVTDKKNNKKLLGLLGGCAATVTALAIIISLAKENRNLKASIAESIKTGNDVDNTPGIEEVIDNDKKDDELEVTIPEKTEEETQTEVKEPEEETKEPEIEEPVVTLDVNNEEMLSNYADSLQAMLPENVLSKEDIITALKLANFDILEDNRVFASREELYKANKDLGVLTQYVGTDKVTIENKEDDIYITEAQLKDMLQCITSNELDIANFDELKEDNGYNIYKVYELCAKKLNDANESQKVLYAKLFNEITARKFESFSLTPSSPLSQYYLMLGMFNENMQASLNLTTNHGWGPTYGEVQQNSSVPGGYTGDTIDGTYGYICIEELINHLSIGNVDYSFYSIYADEFMIDKSLSR